MHFYSAVSLKYLVLDTHHNKEALPGVFGNRGTRSFISGEQGNKGLKIWETKEFWGQGT